MTTTPTSGSPRASESVFTTRWNASTWRSSRRHRSVEQERQRNLEQLDVFSLAALLADLGTARMLASWAESGHSELRRRHFAMLSELEPGPLTVGQLSRSLDITQQAASKTLGELSRLGYVEQSDDTEDRRRRPTSLSPSGREVLRAGLRVRADLAEELRDTLHDGEADDLESVIKLMLERGKSAADQQDRLADRVG